MGKHVQDTDAKFVDPIKWGIAATGIPSMFTTIGAITNGNRSLFTRCVGHSVAAVNKVRFRVGTASGNIDVGFYGPLAGASGLAARPDVQLAKTGSIPAPAAGSAEVTLDAAVTMTPDHWFGFIADNTTVTFIRNATAAGAAGTMFDGSAQFRDAGFPLPSPAGVVSPGHIPMPAIVAAP